MGVYFWTEYNPPELCFTANTASSTVRLSYSGTPASVTLETSTDGFTWSSYTIGTTITLSNIGDKVYFRNTSESDTGFSTYYSDYYYFIMSGSIAGSGDITYLLNKNGTDTLSVYCFYRLFYNCPLTTPPSLPATTLAASCYSILFYECTSLVSLPKLPANNVTAQYCYGNMFFGCTNIKLSTTQTGEYQTEYRIPTTGTGTAGSSSLNSMFSSTGGTFTGTPSINTTYYTSNTVI